MGVNGTQIKNFILKRMTHCFNWKYVMKSLKSCVDNDV